MTPAPGRLVAFEGGEACGKSTQAARLAEALGAVLTREPGGTVLGTRLRALLLDVDTAGLDPRAEALLLAADRAQHVAEVVAPALGAGRHVVTDRFAGSSLAYQGAGRGLDLGAVASLSAFATGGLAPDLNVLLLVPPAEARRRLGEAGRDRFESEPPGFHARVAAGFAALAAADPARWAPVDATGPPDEVAERVRDAVRERLGL